MKRERRVYLEEDWVVVIAGFAIIFAMIAGARIPVPAYNWKTIADLQEKVLTSGNLLSFAAQFAGALMIVVVCALALRKFPGDIFRTFIVVYALTVAALIMAGNNAMRSLNLEAVIFSLVTGLVIGNFFRLPTWLRSSLSAELFVKIGLVLLGTTIIFGDILTAGFLGLIQALVVVFSVWYFAFWICRKLRVDNELTMMISSAVSICGVSAAIATAGAIKGDTKKLSYVISLVLITAIPMMLVMPYVAKVLGLSQEVTGAWLGGTIDTTGAVVASGTLVGETALKVSTIVKFSQNVLLGVAAFVISVYWTYTKQAPDGYDAKPGLSVLWDRFPKFVIGFIAASIIFSFIIDPAVSAGIKENLKSFQNLWFVLAFTSIGLETKFSDLFNAGSKRPLFAFLAAQAFNICVTLLIAWFLFGN